MIGSTVKTTDETGLQVSSSSCGSPGIPSEPNMEVELLEGVLGKENCKEVRTAGLGRRRKKTTI
jgi:hypothetical protein